MKRCRREAGFERLGALGPRELGLPAQRANALLVSYAWLRVAGSALAAKAPALKLHRGTLEIEVADPRWAAVLTRLLPRLAGRLAASFPQLGVRKFRLRVAGESVARPAEPVVTECVGCEATEPGRKDARPAGELSSAPGPAVLLSDRLLDVARRYLDRGGLRRY